MSSATIKTTTRRVVTDFVARLQPRKFRTLRQFAEQEIVIPDGPNQGWRYRCETQPYSGLFFDAVDSGRWNRIFATGPVQSGKTLTTWTIPILYHLFEIGETVIVGVPTGDIVKDKWLVDIKPIIEASRYRDFLPSKGEGSKTGTPSLIQFRNGSSIRFMTGGGSDKQRAAFTARVLAVTEVDGFDKSSATSREADQFTQLEARTRAYDDRKRIYGECTVSTEDGRIWREYSNGTASKIALKCPRCNVYGTPEREHLRGWQNAETEDAAKSASGFVCPACEVLWTEDERRQANRESRLVHRGQEVTPDGVIMGEPAATSTLGFRWSAVNNLLLKSGSYGVDEWRASRAENEDNAEKEMRQFVWCLPYVPDREDTVSLSVDTICRRQHELAAGVYPEGTQHVTIGMDSGKYRSWWVELAWTEGHRAFITNYGQLDVPTNQLGLELATLATLHEFADQCQENHRPPDAVWFDSSYETETHYQFVRETTANMFQPIQGYGVGQRSGAYTHPMKRTATHIWVGEQMACVRDQNRGVKRVDLNADYWKEQAHKSLAGPLDRPGAVTLFSAPAVEHQTFSRHMLAEKKVQEFVKEKGLVTKWIPISKNNHYFDCLAYALAAGARFGHSLVAKKQSMATSSGVKFSEIARSKGI